MNKKHSLKKHLLTGVSIFAFGAFMGQGAVADIVSLDPTASNFGEGAGDINNVNGGGTVTVSASHTMNNTTAITMNGNHTNLIIDGAITITGAGAGNSAIVVNNGSSGSVGDLALYDPGSILTADANEDAVRVDDNNSLATITNVGKFDGKGSGAGLKVGGGTGVIGTIVNDGAITSATGSGVHVLGLIINLNNNGTLSSGGVGSGILMDGINGVITALNNTGTIQSTGGSAISVADGNRIDLITNSKTILDTGAGTGIFFLGNSASSVLNDVTGTISSGADGLGIAVNGVLSGTINNFGMISSTGAGGYGILDAGGVLGGITNSGTIQVDNGLALFIGGSGSNILNGGLITATGVGSGVFFGGANTSTSIGNMGTISSVGNGATSLIVNGSVSGTTAPGDGVISNLGTITTSGNSTNTAISVVGEITNGTGGAYGIYNLGTISSTAGGTALSLAGTVGATTINNAKLGLTNGVIQSSGTGTAVSIGANLTGTLTNEGTIEALGAGVGIGVTSGTTSLIDNSGVIQTADSKGIANGAVYVAVGATITQITNSGTIRDTNGQNAINVAGTLGTLENTGSIGAVIGSGTVNTVTNGGIIDVIGGAGGITNTGTIGEILSAAIVTNTGGDITLIAGAGDVTNTGTIGAVTTATSILNTGGTITAIGAGGDITNTGTIGAITSATTITNTAGSIDSIDGADTITNDATITGLAVLNSGGSFTQAAGSSAAIKGAAGVENISINGGAVSGNIDLGGMGTDVADDGDTINFGDAISDAITLAGTINFDDMKVKFGTITLNGVATGIDATSTLTIDSGAILKANEDINLSGVREINGELDIAAGKIVEGTGAVTIGSSGVLKIAVTDANTYGKITGTSFSQTAGGALAIDASGLVSSLAIGTRLHVFEGTAARGTFTAGTQLSDNSFIYKFTQEAPEVDDGKSVDVLVAMENTYQMIGGGNLGHIGNAIDAARGFNDAQLNALIGILDTYTPAQVEAALNTLLPTAQTSGIIMQTASTDATITAISTQLARILNLAQYDSLSVATGGEIIKDGIWGQAFGSAIDQGNVGGVGGYQANLGGFIVGADTEVSDKTRVGVAFAYGDTNAKATDSTTNIISYQGSVYGTYDMDKLYYEGVVTFAYNDYDTTRRLFDNSVANADFKGKQYSAKATAGYKMNLEGGLKVTPFLSAQYMLVTVDPYSETGSSANLHVNTDNSNIFKTGLGINFAYPITDCDITYIPKMSIAWYHDFIGDAAAVTSNFTSAPSAFFASRGGEIDRNEFKFGTGLDILSQDSLTISLDYTWNSKQNFSSHTGEVKARSEF